MSFEDWRVGFKQALVDAIVQGGYPIRDRDTVYGWEDFEGRKGKLRQIQEEGIDYVATTYDDSDWHEFMGTFYTGDTTVHGIDAEIVTSDGSRFRWRYKATMGELIQAVLRGV